MRSRWFGPLPDVRLHLSVAVLVIGWVVKDRAPPAVDVVGDAPLAPAPPRLVARPGAGEADARRAGAGSEVRWDEGPRRGPDQGVGDESVVAVERPVEIGSQSAVNDEGFVMIRDDVSRLGGPIPRSITLKHARTNKPGQPVGTGRPQSQTAMWGAGANRNCPRVVRPQQSATWASSGDFTPEQMPGAAT
jgi:hypothetical protein